MAEPANGHLIKFSKNAERTFTHFTHFFLGAGVKQPIWDWRQLQSTHGEAELTVFTRPASATSGYGISYSSSEPRFWNWIQYHQGLSLLQFWISPDLQLFLLEGWMEPIELQCPWAVSSTGLHLSDCCHHSTSETPQSDKPLGCLLWNRRWRKVWSVCWVDRPRSQCSS